MAGIPIEDLVKLAVNGELAKVTLQPLRVTNQGDEFDDRVFQFQYWPETIADSKEVNYATMEPIGGSHPLYQWISSGARQISFQAAFTNEISNVQRVTAQVTGGTQSLISPLLGLENEYSVDVRGAIAWLRQFLFPIYDRRENGQNAALAKPPRRLLLHVPGTNLGRVMGITADTLADAGSQTGGDFLQVILLRADVTYQGWFPDGTIRVAVVDLTFAETVQGRSIKFVGADAFERATTTYSLTVPRTG